MMTAPMIDPGWVLVVERGETWTAALNTHWRRGATAAVTPRGRPRLRRVESMPAVDAFDPRSSVFVALEVAPSNLMDSLALLDAIHRRPHLGAAALITRQSLSAADLRDLAQATLEAGARVTADSPRRIAPVAAAALRWLEHGLIETAGGLSPIQRALRSLPWQAEPWSVG